MIFDKTYYKANSRQTVFWIKNELLIQNNLKKKMVLTILKNCTFHHKLATKCPFPDN